jgi:hypothetical protein
MTRTHDPVDIVTIGGGLTAALIAAKVLPGTSLRMVSLEQDPAQLPRPRPELPGRVRAAAAADHVRLHRE